MAVDGGPVVPPDASVDMGADAQLPVNCGNGTIDDGEDCDGTAGCPDICRVHPPGSVVIRYRAKVTVVDDPERALSGTISVGDRVWGRAVYSPTLVDTNTSASTGIFEYLHPVGQSEVYGLWIHAGIWEFHPAGGKMTVTVANATTDDDQFSVLTSNPLSRPPLAGVQHTLLSLKDSRRTALATDALPVSTLPPIDAWTLPLLAVGGTNSGTTVTTWQFQAAVDEVVLEPSTR